ncbi:MAG TPA: Yip1 family protein [Candidatus Binataceae bacterium]|nr:Yip1 family protein [Candidatus Binataceae bacterium]
MDPTSLLESPYIRICIRPRETIRAIVDRDPRHMVIALVVVGALIGAGTNLIFSSNPTAFVVGNKPIPMFDPHKWRILSLASLVIGPLAAIVILYLQGVVLRWSGALLGGTAKAVEVRAALGWATIPGIAANLVITLAGLIFPHSFVPGGGDPHAMLSQMGQMIPYVAVIVVVLIWATVVSLKCIGEVHRFSAWRALGASLIGFFAIGGGALVVAIVVLLVAFPFLK